MRAGGPRIVGETVFVRNVVWTAAAGVRLRGAAALRITTGARLWSGGRRLLRSAAALHATAGVRWRTTGALRFVGSGDHGHVLPVDLPTWDFGRNTRSSGVESLASPWRRPVLTGCCGGCLRAPARTYTRGWQEVPAAACRAPPAATPHSGPTPAPLPSPRPYAAVAPDPVAGVDVWGPGSADAPGRAGARDRAEAVVEWATARVGAGRDPGWGTACRVRVRAAAGRDPVEVAGERARGRGRVVRAPATAADRYHAWSSFLASCAGFASSASHWGRRDRERSPAGPGTTGHRLETGGR